MSEFIFKYKKVIWLCAFGALAVGLYITLFRGLQANANIEHFTIPLDAKLVQIIEKLKNGGFIKSEWAFKTILFFKGGSEKITPGSYQVSKAMSVWRVASVLTEEPYMKWVVIPEGKRKEEIADILATQLQWSDEQKMHWISTDTIEQPDYIEGVYFPDTYLIPRDESPIKVAERLQAKFQEKFAPYLKEALQQNIKWTTVIKLASIIERETGSSEDMPLIAGILWNRLLQGIKLDVDSTLQYAKGKTNEGWWAPVKSEDKKIDSPYNTYTHKGLPPHPISNPGTDAMQAVVRPAKTSCLFYLHDSSRQIHCSVTYAEHQQNIKKYLQ